MDLGTYDVALNFHGVGKPKRRLDKGEDAYWISTGFFSDIVHAVADSRRRVVITFDDGNASDIEICAPLLASKDLKAAFFVLAGRVDQEGSLSAADLSQLLNDGMEIGTHGYDHIDWTAADSATLRREIVEARTVLETICGRRMAGVAIPFGKYNRRVIQSLQAAGYKNIFTSDGGDRNGLFAVLPRTSVRSGMNMADIHRILSGQESQAQTLRRQISMFKKRWF